MFRNPFSFEGRIRRLEFGLSLIIYFVCAMILQLVTMSIQTPFLSFILFVPVVWFLWAQGAKRCHDLDKSGWWQIVPFYFIVMIFQDGNYDVNEYGSNPKTGSGDALPAESETLDQHFRSN